MKITILGRNQAARYKPEGERAWIISITDPDKPPCNFTRDRYKRILRLSFDDVMEDDPRNGLRLISWEEADLIARFAVAAEYHADEIVVHCEAGISRSAGVAAAICRIYEIDDTFCYQQGRHPNIEVKMRVQHAWGKFRDEPLSAFESVGE